MNTVREVRLLQKTDRAGTTILLRWSDEPKIIGYGINFEMAATDLAERRDKLGLSNRPTERHVAEKVTIFRINE